MITKFPNHLLALNGEQPSANFFKNNTFTQIIAADGAAFHLKKLGIRPDCIIGDMDSVFRLTGEIETDHSAHFPTTKFIKVSDQDTTDFEKALIFVKQEKLNNFLITGMNGFEIDHAIHNLQLFGRYSRDLNLCFYHEVPDMPPQWGFIVDTTIELAIGPGTPVSLIPMPNATVSTRGLQWNLKNAALGEKSTSIRNRATHDVLRLDVTQGALLMIIQTHKLGTITAANE